MNKGPKLKPAPTNSQLMSDLREINLKKPLSRTLFSDTAKKWAEVLSQAGKDKNTSTQLRRFYDELVMWHDKVWQEQQTAARDARFTECEPFIQMMQAKVAYARGRRYVDNNFEQLFRQLMQEVTNAETLRYAKLFFEALIGFKKSKEPR